MYDGKRFPFVLLAFTGIALAGGVLLPLGGFVVFGSVYFAPQALFPFMFVGLASAGALWMSSGGKRIPAILLGLLLLLLGAYGVYGIGHMTLVSRLRGLQGSEVRELRFTSLADDSKTIVVRESTAVNEIVESLGDTHPYSPNHAGITEPWQLRLDLTDGTAIGFSLGKGNRAHPHTAWIEFGVKVYQNPTLYRTLEDQGIGLWSNGELGRDQEEMPNQPDGSAGC